MLDGRCPSEPNGGSMIELELDIFIEDVLDRLDAMGREAPFILAKALTKTAQVAQVAVRGNLLRDFTIRNQAVVRGIRIRPATKNNLEAAIGSVDPFMVLQETGGTKLPKAHSTLAIPDSRRPAGSIRRRSQGSITAATRPAALLASSRPQPAKRRSPGKARANYRYFVIEFRDSRSALVRSVKGKVRGLRQLRGERVKGKKYRGQKVYRKRSINVLNRTGGVGGSGFEFVWTFSRGAKIGERFGLQETVERVASRELPKLVSEGIAELMAKRLKSTGKH